MFGKIIGFDNSKIVVENNKGVADTNYIGYHVVFPEPDHKIVGEIIGIDATKIVILLIGEIIDNKFSNGVLKKPSLNTVPRIIFKSELEAILGSQNFAQKGNLLFGTSPIYKDYYVTSDLSNFFANHFAIIGNTGSGKSCGLARLIQNIFFISSNEKPKNAHIALFDVYGEYYNTFDGMNNFEGLHCKKYTTQLEFGSANLLRFPAYFLEVDDLAILLGADDATQLPVLEKAIDLVKIFRSQDPQAIEFKNDIIARAILDILSSGKSSAQIRDQVVSILTTYNTESLSLNSIIRQPGYDRTFKQCLTIDDQGKINAMNLIIDFLQKMVRTDMGKAKLENEQVVYSLEDLYQALEFALLNEGAFTSETVYEKNNSLKSRLKAIIGSDKVNYFKEDTYMTKTQYIHKFFTTDDETGACQLVDINLSYIDDNFAKCLTKIYSKLFFEHTTSLEQRGSYSIHIVLEEAHRFVRNDRDEAVIGYNIFDRISKEGRKYGTIIGYITQRPNELSKTALSQCSNFVVFRLFYPEDLNIVRGISSNVTEETIEKIKTLHPGMGLVFGTAFKVPLLVNFPLPNPMPISTSLKIDEVWYQ